MRKALLPLLVVLFGASPAMAQNPIELGVDGAFWYSITSELGDFEVPDVTIIWAPVQFRAGFFLNDNISIEPGLGVWWYKEGDDGAELMAGNLNADVLYHFSSSSDTQFFVHGGGMLQMFRAGEGGESESNMQFGFGGGAGVKVPIQDNLMFRFGARAVYLLENDKEEFPRAASLNIIGTLGLSMMLQ